MQYIKDLVNKIKWSKEETPADYSLCYWDNVLKDIIEIKFSDIKKIEGTFIVIERDNEETHIPMHRIRVVKKKNKVIWNR